MASINDLTKYPRRNRMAVPLELRLHTPLTKVAYQEIYRRIRKAYAYWIAGQTETFLGFCLNNYDGRPLRIATANRRGDRYSVVDHPSDMRERILDSLIEYFCPEVRHRIMTTISGPVSAIMEIPESQKTQAECLTLKEIDALMADQTVLNVVWDDYLDLAMVTRRVNGMHLPTLRLPTNLKLSNKAMRKISRKKYHPRYYIPRQ